MPESLISELQVVTSLSIEIELQGQDLVVWGKNQGVHPLWLQSLIILRRFENGSETRVHFGEGFSEPLQAESRMLHCNQRTRIATLTSSERVLAAQAMAGYVEVTGLSMSDYVEFSQ